MALKLELKIMERLIVAGTVCTNMSDRRIRLAFEGRTPIIREKDFLPKEQATTPARIFYHAVQTVLLYGPSAERSATYDGARARLLAAMPEEASAIAEVDANMETGRLHKALKATKDIIDREGHEIVVFPVEWESALMEISEPEKLRNRYPKAAGNPVDGVDVGVLQPGLEPKHVDGILAQGLGQS